MTPRTSIAAAGVVSLFVNEGRVDFHGAEREVAQHDQGGVTGAEVIEVNLDSSWVRTTVRAA